MNILAIDTSNDFVQVALRKDNTLYESSNKTKFSHIEDLAGMVTKLLSDSKTEPPQLSAIGIGSGPGSFTGLRISYSFLAGFVSILKIPFYSISSLKGSAYKYFPNYPLVACMRDARRNELFYSLFYTKNGRTDELTSKGTKTIEEIEDSIIEIRRSKGLSKEQILTVSENKEIPNFNFLPFTNAASGIIHYFSEELLNKPTSLNISKLAPDYVREVSARKIGE